jgi:plastocyanin
MKKLLVVLAILFIGILLAGCTSQPAAPVATPTPTPTPVPTVVTTVPPTPEPTKEIIVVVVNKTATPTPTPTPIPTVTITFTQQLSITPGTTVTIPVGGKVAWVNADPYNPHGVQATDDSDGPFFGGYSTATIPYGKPLEVTFAKKGVYDYVTIFQPATVGQIIVK